MPTGDERVDALLRATLTTFEAAFPRRVRGYYLLGSAADGTSVSTSDVDLVILFKDQFLDAAEREAAQQLRDQIASASPLEYDAELHDEASLREGSDPALKLGSQLLYGEDVRHLPLVPIEDWARDRLHTSYWRVMRLFNRPTPPTTRMSSMGIVAA